MADAKHSTGLMREYNEKLLYNLIRTQGPISRMALAKKTKMSPTSVGRIIGDSLEDGFIQEVGTVDGNVGRKATLLNIIPENVLAIGIDIGIPQIRVGLVNIQGDITYRCSKDNNPGNTVEQMLALAKAGVNEILGSVSAEVKRRIVGVGVSVVGPVDWTDGVVMSAPQFGWEKPVPLLRMMQKDYDYDVVVDNDVKSVAKAEQLFDHNMTSDDFLIVYIGSGIGTALCLNGRLVRGSRNLAGEIGHIIVEPDGILCDCGRRGCLQATACISGIEHVTGKKFEEVMRLAEKGDADSAAVLDKTASYLAMWITNLALTYDPSEIILYGDMLNHWPQLAGLIEERHTQYLWKTAGEALHIRPSSLRMENIPYLGAAANAFYKFTMADVSVNQ